MDLGKDRTDTGKDGDEEKEDLVSKGWGWKENGTRQAYGTTIGTRPRPRAKPGLNYLILPAIN